MTSWNKKVFKTYKHVFSFSFYFYSISVQLNHTPSIKMFSKRSPQPPWICKCCLHFTAFLPMGGGNLNDLFPGNQNQFWILKMRPPQPIPLLAKDRLYIVSIFFIVLFVIFFLSSINRNKGEVKKALRDMFRKWHLIPLNR